MTPSLSETIASNDSFYDPEENLEDLPPRRRMLYEIERLLGVDEKEMQFEFVRKKKYQGRGRGRVPNRDFYRIYKALCQRLNVQPRFVYTGNDVLDMEEAQELVEDADATLERLEPSL